MSYAVPPPTTVLGFTDNIPVYLDWQGPVDLAYAQAVAGGVWSILVQPGRERECGFYLTSARPAAKGPNYGTVRLVQPASLMLSALGVIEGAATPGSWFLLPNAQQYERAVYSYWYADSALRTARTACHEIGHAMNLDHVTTPGNLMVSTTAPTWFDLTPAQRQQIYDGFAFWKAHRL